MKKRILALILALALCICAVSVSLGDAGSFAGDSDYGGGWDSGWDSGSDWDSDWDSDYDSGYVSGGGYYDDDDGGNFGTIGGIIVLIIIVFIFYTRSKKSAGKQGNQPYGAANPAPQGERRSIAEIREEDPAFSEQAFLQDISNSYIKMQNAWTEKDWEPMRMLMTDSLFAQFANQLEAMKRANRTNYVERISVLGTRVTGVYRDDVNDIITVEVRTRIVDYTKDDNTGKVISGNPNKELFMTYEWTMVRPIGVKTESFEGERRTTCPSCGAPLAINASNRCEYCGTLVSASEHGWAISSIRGISQVSGN